MFRITEDPSSGRLVQYLAKITKMIQSCNPMCVCCLESEIHTHTHIHMGLQYAAITPTTSMSTDTIESFL